jgi:putative transport protein
MVEWFFATLRQYPEIAIFLTLALGYYFGKFTFKGIGLGSVTATLLAGVVIGQIGITINQPLKATAFPAVPVRRRLRRRSPVRPRRRQDGLPQAALLRWSSAFSACWSRSPS